MNHGIYYNSCNDGTDTQYLKLTGKQDRLSTKEISTNLANIGYRHAPREETHHLYR